MIQKLFQLSFNLFLFLLPWQTILIIQKWELGTIGIFGFEIVLWLVGILFFLIKIKSSVQKNENKSDSNASSVLFISCSLFLAYVFVSTFWSPQKMVAFFQAIRISEGFLIVCILLSPFYNKTKAIFWFLVGATIQSILGIYQFLTQSTFSSKWLGLVSHPLMETGTSVVQSPEAGRWLRAYGAFPHPNIFGGYLVVAIIFTSLMFFNSITQNQTNKNTEDKLEKNLKSKKVGIHFLREKNNFFFVLLALQITALFFTFSRSAWIATALWFFGLFFLRFFKHTHQTNQNKKILLVLCLIFICDFSILTALYFPLIKTRTVATSYHEVRSLQERKDYTKFAFNLFKEYPIFGVGVGNYVPVLFETLPNKQQWVYEPVHVVPLLMLVELGIIGFALFIFNFFLLLNKKMTPLLWILLLSLSPLFLLDHYLYSSPIGILFFAVSFGFFI